MDANKFIKIGVGSLAIVIAVYIVYLMVVPLVVSYYAINKVHDSVRDKEQDSEKKLYVLDSSHKPITVSQSGTSETLDMEAKNHVELFHHLFFTLAPDDMYIKNSIDKAMYLVDETGRAQYNALKEKGFYNNIIGTGAVFSIICDSIQFDKEKMQFTYYGRQRIERRTNILTRQLITTGELKCVPRTENNPYGLLISNWRTLLNKDLEQKQKNVYH